MHKTADEILSILIKKEKWQPLNTNRCVIVGGGGIPIWESATRVVFRSHSGEKGRPSSASLSPSQREREPEKDTLDCSQHLPKNTSSPSRSAYPMEHHVCTFRSSEIRRGFRQKAPRPQTLTFARTHTHTLHSSDHVFKIVEIVKV